MYLLDPKPDDFQNSMVISLSKDTSLIKLDHEDPISSFYVKLLTDRQTNTDKTSSFSLHFNGHFPGEPGLAGVY